MRIFFFVDGDDLNRDLFVFCFCKGMIIFVCYYNVIIYVSERMVILENVYLRVLFI